MRGQYLIEVYSFNLFLFVFLLTFSIDSTHELPSQPLVDPTMKVAATREGRQWGPYGGYGGGFANAHASASANSNSFG